MWRYQRNLTGFNEGLNVIMHLSHVGACTGRDHFSGWSLDWINLALGYLPFLHRFYAPADARSAFIAVRDATAAYGGHIIAIPRDNLPVLTQADGRTPLWNAGDAWTPVTPYRERKGARAAILTIGARTARRRSRTRLRHSVWRQPASNASPKCRRLSATKSSAGDGSSRRFWSGTAARTRRSGGASSSWQG